MNISYDNSVDAMYIKLKEGTFGKNEEVAEGVILDISDDNQLLGIEILDASQHFDLKQDFGQITFQLPLASPFKQDVIKEKVVSV